MLFDAIPPVVFEEAKFVAIPNPILSVFALHLGMVAVEADGSLAILLGSEESACRPAVHSVAGTTTPAGFAVCSTNTGELSSAGGIPAVAEAKVVAEEDFVGLAAFGFCEGEFDARSVVLAFWGFDRECLPLKGDEFLFLVSFGEGGGFSGSTAPLIFPILVFELGGEKNLGIRGEVFVSGVFPGEPRFRIERRDGEKKEERAEHGDFDT